MRRTLAAISVVAAIGFSSTAFAQSYEQLQTENKRLHAEIEALKAEHGDHDHEAGPDAMHSEHEHAGTHEEHAPPSHLHGACNSACNSNCSGHDHCHEHFDFCLPFEGHDGGHGHCDLCGCGHGHNGHGNEHEHGPAYHHSMEGYLLFHGIRTEIDFVERSLEFQLADVNGADGGEVDELEYEMELVYAINDRLVLIMGVPLVSLDPIEAPNTTGIGDLEFGVRFMAFNGQHDGVFFGLNVSAPTGDPNRDLGEGNAILEPTALWAHDFGCGTYMQSVIAWEMPVDVDDPSNDFRYDIALFHTFIETEHAEAFRYFTPILEVNGVTTMNGPESGRTVVDLTTGVRWLVRDEDEVGIGWSFPITGDRNFDDLLVISYFRHF